MGPDRVTPIYNSVVLINVDTVYASAFLDLRAGPVVLTVPETPVNYSILLLDPYGDIFQTALQPNTPGVYALTGPGFSGALPPGVTPVTTLLNAMTLIFRADRYAPASSATPYADETAQATRSGPPSSCRHSAITSATPMVGPPLSSRKGYSSPSPSS